MRAKRDNDEHRLCANCTHTAALHSNEACEAIRCECRVTRKMLAAAAPPVKTNRVTVSVTTVSAKTAAVEAEPATTTKKTKPRRRRDADDTQAA